MSLYSTAQQMAAAKQRASSRDSRRTGDAHALEMISQLMGR